MSLPLFQKELGLSEIIRVMPRVPRTAGVNATGYNYF
jgi:hypothetical protein